MSPIETLPPTIGHPPAEVLAAPVIPTSPLPASPSIPSSAEVPGSVRNVLYHALRHEVPQAASSLLRTIIVALFVLTFVTQPMVIPSESMEHTLLVGDFLLMNRATLAPAGIWKRILPYGDVDRGEIVTFHSPLNPKEYLVKRVIEIGRASCRERVCAIV